MSSPLPLSAIDLARRASSYLEHSNVREAAFHALYALELDSGSAVAWSVIARILGEVSAEPLALLAAKHALALGLEGADRQGLERHHRIDLWSRGLLMHAERRAILSAVEFDDSGRFQVTPRLKVWFDEEIAEWGDMDTAARASRRMVGALSDAYLVPEMEGENPLRSDEGWSDHPAYAKFKEMIAENGLSPIAAAEAKVEPTVLSDYWMEQEIVQLAASGLFQEAVEHAAMWSQLRPDHLKPKCALLRVRHAAGRIAERDETAKEIVATPTNDLNDLEDARIALGELRMWREQIEILDRMEAIAPGHSVILANRGVARIELGDRKQGREDLEASLEIDPNNGPALANLGLEHMREDEYVSARELLERAVNVAPEQIFARIYLAACKNNQGDRSGAMSELEEALRIEPDNQQATQMLKDIRSFVVQKPS